MKTYRLHVYGEAPRSAIEKLDRFHEVRDAAWELGQEAHAIATQRRASYPHRDGPQPQTKQGMSCGCLCGHIRDALPLAACFLDISETLPCRLPVQLASVGEEWSVSESLVGARGWFASPRLASTIARNERPFAGGRRFYTVRPFRCGAGHLHRAARRDAVAARANALSQRPARALAVACALRGAAGAHWLLASLVWLGRGRVESGLVLTSFDLC